MQHHVPKVQFYFYCFVPQEKCLDTNLTSSTEIFLTEEMDSDHLVCNVQTVSNCTHSKSIPATIIMYPPRPRGKGHKANMTALLSRDIVFWSPSTCIMLLGSHTWITFAIMLHSWTGEGLQVFCSKQNVELFLDPNKFVSGPDSVIQVRMTTTVKKWRYSLMLNWIVSSVDKCSAQYNVSVAQMAFLLCNNLKISTLYGHNNWKYLFYTYIFTWYSIT